MNPEEKLAWQGNVHFYNALSEFFLYQDLHSLSSIMQSMLQTRYGPRAKRIIELIHAENERLVTEGEIRVLKEELSLLERNFGTVDPNQLYVYYKNSGYEIEDIEPDHLAAELRFAAILALETLEKETLAEGAAKELRFLNNRFEWLEDLMKKAQNNKPELRLFKEVLALTQEYLADHRAFLTAVSHEAA